MALDYQEVRRQIAELGERSPKHYQLLQNRRLAAQGVLADVAESLDILRQTVAEARRRNPNLRCAVPALEPLNAHFSLPAAPQEAVLLAADGSQINPDRHAQVDYCLVNVGTICMTHGSAETPRTTIRSRLYYDEEMYTENGRMTERLVALMRDLEERTVLADLAKGLAGQVITLTDGPLELWLGQEGGQEAGEYKRLFEAYLETLGRLRDTGASTAGYIDKPAGDLFVRLLEIACLKPDQLAEAGKNRTFRQVKDTDIFQDLLGPCERSAVFGIQSRHADKYAEDLALHFFYLNVSEKESRPYLARVEVPGWVVATPGMIDSLHALLVHQCRILGTRPYPYLLHRSHEAALVSLDEKQQVANMIALELRSHGVPVGVQSHKQTAKEAGGRGRY
jgi:hypothetical protein